MKFEEKLPLLRKKRGMTQSDLAEALNVSRQAISKWERGVAAPSTENLICIGKLFDVSVDDLVNDDLQIQKQPVTVVAVAEEPEAAGPPRPNTLKAVGAVALAASILLTGVVGGIIISSTLLSGPEESKNTIIWTDDLNEEDIDLAELEPFSDTGWEIIIE